MNKPVREPIATWLTIANQRALLDKYDDDNTALMQENAKLKARTLSCVFCGDPMETMEALKKHSADCPKHPAVIESSKLKAQVERLSVPVNMQDQSDFANRLSDGDEDHPCDRLFDATDVDDLIASRLAGKEPSWGASENITVLPEKQGVCRRECEGCLYEFDPELCNGEKEHHV